MRLGFPGRVYGLKGSAVQAEVCTLGKWLAHMLDVFQYLAQHKVCFYRIVPPRIRDSRHYESQARDQGALLAFAAQEAESADIRLSAHMPTSLSLTTPDDFLADAAIDWLKWVSHLLCVLALTENSVIVVHAGAKYGDRESAIARFSTRYERLPLRVRNMLCLEHDDRRMTLGDVLAIHTCTGIPIVLDNLHLNVLNPEGYSLCEALSLSLASWSIGRVPKVHYCDPRTEARGLGTSRTKIPSWTEHSDFCNPFAFVDFMRCLQGIGQADVMLEARARDIAWLKLRNDLVRYAPDVLAMFTE